MYWVVDIPCCPIVTIACVEHVTSLITVYIIVTFGVLKISQENFVAEVLRRFNMENCSVAPTPAVDSGAEAAMVEEDLPVSQAQLDEIKDLPFLELIGCLWWLAQMSRLDIFVALQRASHWVSKPSVKLWRWLTRILKYLAGTKTIGLVFSATKQRSKAASLFRCFFRGQPRDALNCGVGLPKCMERWWHTQSSESLLHLLKLNALRSRWWARKTHGNAECMLS